MRFNDEGKTIYDFWDRWIVECPNCQKPVDIFNGKVACVHCGYNKSYETTQFGSAKACFIDLKNYLEIDCCGEKLWATNLEHLNFLEEYVLAKLRERVINKNKSVASRLPQWIKSQKNRDEILKAIQKLRKRLSDDSYQSMK